MDQRTQYEIEAVRQRIFHSTFKLESKTLANNPEVLDALLLKSPQARGIQPRTPSGTLFSSAQRALSSTSGHRPQMVPQSYDFQPVELSQTLNLNPGRAPVETYEKWRGKEDFTSKIRSTVRQQFQEVQYNKQIQRCVDECKTKAYDEQNGRDQLYSELRRDVLQIDDQSGKMDLEAEKLQVRIENALKSNHYLRLRIDSERRQLAEIGQSPVDQCYTDDELQAIYDAFAYVPPDRIIDQILSLENAVLKAYTRECDAGDEMSQAQQLAAQHQLGGEAAAHHQAGVDKRTHSKLEFQAGKLRADQNRLEEDANEAKRADNLLQSLSASVWEFYDAWSSSLLQLIDSKRLEALKTGAATQHFFSRPADPLNALETLSQIADYVIAQRGCAGSAAGQAYRKIAICCEQIYKTLYLGETELARDVVAIAQRVCTGAVEGELSKERKMKDIQVLEQDIIKLIQVRDDLEKWQIQVIEQLEQLIKRKEMRIQ